MFGICNIRKICFGIIVLLVVLITYGCVSVISPTRGKVRDADTNEPIKDVIVFCELSRTCGGGAAGGSSTYMGSSETLTNSRGNFLLAFLKVKVRLPLLCPWEKRYN